MMRSSQPCAIGVSLCGAGIAHPGRTYGSDEKTELAVETGGRWQQGLPKWSWHAEYQFMSSGNCTLKLMPTHGKDPSHQPSEVSSACSSCRYDQYMGLGHAYLNAAWAAEGNGHIDIGPHVSAWLSGWLRLEERSHVTAWRIHEGERNLLQQAHAFCHSCGPYACIAQSSSMLGNEPGKSELALWHKPHEHLQCTLRHGHVGER